MKISDKAGAKGVQIAGALAVLLMLAGCAGSGGVPASGASSPQQAAPAATALRSADTVVDGGEDDAPVIGRLPPQELEPGSCGLFLWAQDTRRALVFFAESLSGQGRLIVDGAEQTVTRSNAEGNSAFGQFERQTYGGAALTVDLTLGFETQNRMIGGVRVPRGVMSVAQPGGWRLSVPVAGLIGCTPPEN